MLCAPQLVADVVDDGPFARMGGELAEFIADPDQCAILLTTLAEEMPVQEALELIASLDERMSRRPQAVIVNSLYPAAAGTDLDAVADRDPLVALWLERRRVNDRELRRLSAAWDGPRVELPMLAIDRGPQLVGAIEERLEAMLTREV
jgi:hypothetical protein